MTERQFQSQVVKLAKACGWLVYHTYDSRRSEPGFPDLVLVKGKRLIFAELKTDKGILSEAQERWLAALREAGRVAVVWRPDDKPEIEWVLTAR